MLPHQREWIQEFHRRLAAHLKTSHGLREECFLQLKFVYPDLINKLTETSSEYIPMIGASLVPGTLPPLLPDFEAIKKQVENASKDGKPVDVNKWMPDHMLWFLLKKPEKQRADFFGVGGMLTLYLPPDPEAIAPVFEMPRIVKSHPAYSDTMQTEIQAGYSLRDNFLMQSKNIFGEPFRRDPSFRGLLFALPLLTSSSLLSATADQREAWFTVFSAYLIESKPDRGMLLAVKWPDFDLTLAEITDCMKEDGFVYRI